MALSVVGLALGALIVFTSSTGSSLLTLVASAAAMAVSVVSPVIGIVVLAFVAPIPRPLVVPPPGLWMIMVGAVILGVILRLPIDRPRMGAPSATVVLTGTFLLYVVTHAAAELLGGSSASEAYAIASRFEDLFTALLAFVVAGFVLRGRSPFPVIAALLASAVLASAAVLLPEIGISGWFGRLAVTSESAQRAIGFFNDPNYFGAYLAIAITLALACATFVRSRAARILTLMVASLGLLALFTTLSRGAFVALFAGVITIAFVRSRRAGVAVMAAVALVAVIGYPLLAEVRYSSVARLADASTAEQLESSGRLGTWSAAIEVFSTSPILGVGFGDLVEQTGISAHNWYFSVLAEGGLVGIGLWLLLITAIFLALRRTSHQARTVGYSVLAAWMVTSVFLDTPRFYQATALAVFSLAAALTADWIGRGRDSSAAALPGSRHARGNTVSRAAAEGGRQGA